MRVLLAHNYYQQPGGEDRVFAAEASLLERNGHEVVRYCQHNDRVGRFSRAGAALRTVWNHESYTQVRNLLRKARPAVCHFHNTFPLISPAAFYAARAEGVPVVLTLHNYRLLCPGATMMRNGSVCEDCRIAGAPWPAVVHGCYRGDRAASAAVALMLAAHRCAGTWSRVVTRYIALSEFARRKFTEGGLPEERVMVKPNFIAPDPGYSANRNGHALFVGRLSPEKGIETLLQAWRVLKAPIGLRIAGDGPMADMVAKAATRDRRIEWLGALGRDQVIDQMKQARVLVFPSVWYEGLPLTIIEAYATGLPVIAGRIGTMLDLVTPGETGWHFQPGDPDGLARQVASCHERPSDANELGHRARREYERTYTADENYRRLMDIYHSAGEAS